MLSICSLRFLLQFSAGFREARVAAQIDHQGRAVRKFLGPDFYVVHQVAVAAGQAEGFSVADLGRAVVFRDVGDAIAAHENSPALLRGSYRPGCSEPDAVWMHSPM